MLKRPAAALDGGTTGADLPEAPSMKRRAAASRHDDMLEEQLTEVLDKAPELSYFFDDSERGGAGGVGRAAGPAAEITQSILAKIFDAQVLQHRETSPETYVSHVAYLYQPIQKPCP